MCTVRLKHSYNKACYVCSWKYPRLHDFLLAAKFPTQLLALCFALYIAVGFYQQHFSFEAHQRNAVKTSSSENIHPLAFKTYVSTFSVTQYEVPATVRSTELNSATITALHANNDQSLAVVASKSDDADFPSLPAVQVHSADARPAENADAVLLDQVLIAEELLKLKKQQTRRLEEKVARAKGVLQAHNLHNEEWLLQQPDNHFIVQIAASSEPKLLEEFIRTKPVKGPIAIYPFKLNKEGKLMYGLSSGLYIAREDAVSDLAQLSEISQHNGVWVRKVAAIRRQFAALEQLERL